MATKGAERWSTGISMPSGFSDAMQAIGGLFAMAADAIRFTFRRPFQAREFLEQAWFVARVALAPSLLVAIPFTVLVSFILNILLRELGAADLSGAGAAFGAVTQLGPLVTVLIVAGAGATAMCADLGSRTIREEIDAMEVLGINPVQRLVTPRMLAAGLVALLLNSLVVIIGIVGGYVFSVFVQDVNPGAFAAGTPLLTGVPEGSSPAWRARRWGSVAVLMLCFLPLAAGGTLAVPGYSSLGNIGIEALTGFLAAFINVRIAAPVVAGIGLAATFGAGVTAQLGAMRISEEIDALEAMAIRPISYLVSTRIVAGMLAITPLYSIAVILSFLASQFTTTFLLGQSQGFYEHYFT